VRYLEIADGRAAVLDEGVEVVDAFDGFGLEQEGLHLLLREVDLVQLRMQEAQPIAQHLQLLRVDRPAVVRHCATDRQRHVHACAVVRGGVRVRVRVRWNA
jgi:hypothetical protein